MASTLFGQTYGSITGLCQNNSIMGMPIDPGSLYDDGQDVPAWYGFTVSDGIIGFVVGSATITGVQVVGPNPPSE